MSIKIFSCIILLLIPNSSIILCLENFEQILANAYSTLSNLPIGSTIYYSRNTKCTSYSSISSICLINERLYKIDNNKYIILSNITGYSDSYYYELNLYNDSNIYINCLISHFLNENELIFKYYSINTQNNSVSGEDFYFKNESLNPINKGINCQTKDGENQFSFTCFYLNKDKQVIQMEINPIDDSLLVRSSFKKAVFQDKTFLNNNTLLMSSFYNNKFKLFSCFLSGNNDNLEVHVKKQGNIYFSPFNGMINSGNMQSLNFNCQNNENIILFVLFKDQCHSGNNCRNYMGSFNLNPYIFYETNKGLRNLEPGDIPGGGQEKVLYLKNVNDFSGKALYFEEIENILFVQANPFIQNFQFEEKNDKTDNIYQKLITTSIRSTEKLEEKNDKTDNFHQKLITTSIHLTEKISPQIIKTDKLKFETNSIKQEKTFNINKVETMKIIIEKKEKIKQLPIQSKNVTKEEIIQNIKEIMEETVIGETYEYEEEDLTILIYPTDSDLLTNKTHINFVGCEYSLKSHYNLSNDSILTFFQMEISNKNERSLINQVEYQVFDEQKNPLDLSICNDSNIKIFYGIKNNTKLNTSIINTFKDSGVDVFNISDEFFNDVCYPYSENGNYLILEDRIKDIYQNYSLCEEGCTYEDIDISNMLISCECNVKNNMTNIVTEIKEEAAEKISSLNFEIVKCYNLVFSFNGKIKNIGFWVLSIFFVIYIISLIIYCFNGINPVKQYIFNEMNKYGYINNSSFPKVKTNKSTKKQNNIFTTRNRRRTNVNYPPIKNKNKIKKRSLISGNMFRNNNNNKNSSIHNINTSINNILNKKNKSNNKKIVNLGLNLISINLNDLSCRDISPKDSNITLYNYTMEEAFKYDRRNILVIFYIYLLSKQAFFHAFLYRSPLVLFPLRFCLLLFIISSDLALNAFFYFNDNISRKYRYTKSIFIFAVSNNITVILLSTLVGFILLTLFTILLLYY